MRIFISYANEQANVAERIYLKLLAAGYEVFFGRDSIRAADDFDERIRNEINKADALLFLASWKSIEEGRFSRTELRMFSEKWPNPSKRVLTVLLDEISPVDLPPYLVAVTSAFKPRGNVPSEVVAAALKRWPLKKRRWLMWAGALVLTVTAAITAFQLIPNPEPVLQVEKPQRNSEEPTKFEPTDSSQLSDNSSETIAPIKSDVQENAQQPVPAVANAAAETGSISIRYTGDAGNCSVNIAIWLENNDLTITPTGSFFSVDDLVLGDDFYEITGTISCPLHGSCVASGEDDIDLRNGYVYDIVWENSDWGQCNIGLVNLIQ